MNDTDLEESLLSIARSGLPSQVVLSQHTPVNVSIPILTSRPRSAPTSIRIGLPTFKPVTYNPHDSDSGEESDASVASHVSVTSQRSQGSNRTTVVRGAASYSLSFRKPEAGGGVVVRCSSGSPPPKGNFVNIEVKKSDQNVRQIITTHSGRSSPVSRVYSSGRASPVNDDRTTMVQQQECRDYEALVPTYACRLPPAPDRREHTSSRSVPVSVPARLVSYHGIAAQQQPSVRIIPVSRFVDTTMEAVGGVGSGGGHYRATMKQVHLNSNNSPVQLHSTTGNAVQQHPPTSTPTQSQQFVSEFRTLPRMSDMRHYQLTPTMDLCGTRSPPASATPGTPPVQKGKEAELDVLTNLLVQNMHAAAEPDFLGMCARCGEPIMGPESGCTALDQLFHVTCFSCVICSENLRERPFYAMEGKSYCEICYLNTLEKCFACHKPVVDRLLRGAGKPYHPSCFTCVVCSKSLDGVPFTVDIQAQIYCIDDFNRKFAPRCATCGQCIVADSGSEESVHIMALDRKFHVNCFKCEDCGLVLAKNGGGGCYPLDGHVLCRSCNTHRIQVLTDPNRRNN